jgi:hypothetical protein
MRRCIPGIVMTGVTRQPRGIVASGCGQGRVRIRDPGPYAVEGWKGSETAGLSLDNALRGLPYPFGWVAYFDARG